MNQQVQLHFLLDFCSGFYPSTWRQYFGGGLDIESMEGYGTDAFLHLRRVGQFKEALPQGPLTGPVDEGDLDDAAYSSALRAAFVDNSTKL